MNFLDDEVLRTDYEKDYERLQAILDLLIPTDNEAEEQNDGES